MGRLVFRIGDDIAPNKTLLRSRLRVCPACILEDVAAGGIGSAYRRQHWNLLSIRHCEAHGQPMLKLPWLEYTFGNYDVVARVSANLSLIEAAAATARGRVFTDYERYLLDRAAGAIRISTASCPGKRGAKRRGRSTAGSGPWWLTTAQRSSAPCS